MISVIVAVVFVCDWDCELWIVNCDDINSDDEDDDDDNN